MFLAWICWHLARGDFGVTGCFMLVVVGQLEAGHYEASQFDVNVPLYVVMSGGQIMSAWTSRQRADAHAQHFCDAYVVECRVNSAK